MLFIFESKIMFKLPPKVTVNNERDVAFQFLDFHFFKKLVLVLELSASIFIVQENYFL